MRGYSVPKFWLDTNVLIQARNGPYGFDLQPGFWEFLNTSIVRGDVGSSLYVYQEIIDAKQDDITQWIRRHRNGALHTAPSKTVQEAYGQVANYVDGNPQFQRRYIAEFLSKADAWVIAHALIEGGEVVTWESRAGDNTTKVKIPNVSARFGVRTTTIYNALRSLGAQFILREPQ